MKKQYISILNLLKDTSTYLREKDRTITMYQHIPGYMSQGYMSQEIMERLPVVIQEPPTTGTELRTIRTPNVRAWERLTEVPSHQMTVLPIPEFLEIEVLRTSEFAYSEEELDCLEQMFMWQVRQWCYVNNDRQMQNLKELLVAKEYLYTLDLEKEPEAAMNRLREIYKSEYQPFDQCTKAYLQKHLESYIAAPVSSIDAIEIMTQLHPVFCRKYDGGDTYHGGYLLFLPLIAMFALLERETTRYKQFTLHNYNSYLGAMTEDIRKAVQEWVSAGQEETAQRGEDAPNYSYGFPPRYNAGTAFSDKNLIIKTLGTIMQHMKSNSVDKNIATVSQRRVPHLVPEQTAKIHVLLDKEELSWEPVETNQTQEDV